MENTKIPHEKLIKWFNATGLIHTIISVSVFVLSLLNYIYGKEIFHNTIAILSTITLLNSVIWLVCALMMFAVAHQLKSEYSVAKIRLILFLSILFVLTPDLLVLIVFWLPMLKDQLWINFIGMISPVLVFIGWFIGKRVGKKSKRAI